MDCDQAVWSLASFLDKHTGEQVLEPFRHLDTCPECLGLFANLLLLRELELVLKEEWGNHGLWSWKGQAERFGHTRKDDRPSVL